MTEKREFKRWRDEGTDLTRILALSDGVFAIALTLLAIDLFSPKSNRETFLWNCRGCCWLASQNF